MIAVSTPLAAEDVGPIRAVRSVHLAGPAGRLEAILNQGSPHARYAALVCHPHPSYGGTMHNKVVYHAMKVMNDPAWGFSLPVLRFNFRGTGLSEGEYDGKTEVDDVEAAIDWLRKQFHLPLIVAGFSFGAVMALECCDSPNNEADLESKDPNRTQSDNQAPSDIQALIALGLPVSANSRNYHYSFLRNNLLPKLFLSGGADEFAPAEQLAEIAAEAAGPTRLQLIPGADHFFTGHLEPMQRELASWLKEQIA